jgi:hypothetical protein
MPCDRDPFTYTITQATWVQKSRVCSTYLVYYEEGTCAG